MEGKEKKELIKVIETAIWNVLMRILGIIVGLWILTILVAVLMAGSALN